mmetsp:Transcript_24726/g.68347  ORF Transcript_24726/g.68347 Transcript_24726/m.68347 type:complete len:409 (-) Transcript_24726:168-1394(-)
MLKSVFGSSPSRGSLDDNASNKEEKYGMNTVNVSFLPSDDGQGKKAYPLLVTPRWEASQAFLMSWCKVNKPWIDKMMTKYGAVLFRGFEINTAIEMQEVILSYRPSLTDVYRGTSPRGLVGGSKYMFSAADAPVHYPIAQHLEMSFLPSTPIQLFFGCLKAPKTIGGETAVADFRGVARDLNPELRQKLVDKGIQYVRTNHKYGSYFTFDVSDMVGWTDIFVTNDKKEVERICEKEGTPVEWKGDTFVSTTKAQPFQLHPITKELTWSNHIQVFHWTTFPAEVWFAFKRCKDIRLFFLFLFVYAFHMMKYGVLGHQMALTTQFGDGEPITPDDAAEIRRAIHKNMVFNRWAKGDILFLDNLSTSHGRQPTFDKGRTVVVAMGDYVEKPNDKITVEFVDNLTSASSNSR